MLYGQRPCHDDVWYLSPYDIATYWQPVLVSYPRSLLANEDDRYHATLTSSGLAKVSQKKTEADLILGEDYVVKDGVPGQWLPFPDTPSTQQFRNTWVLQKKKAAEGTELRRRTSSSAWCG